MGSKASSAPPPDPRLTEATLKSMGLQDSMIQKLISYQDQLTPIQMQEITKGIERADKQYDYDVNRQDRLDKQATDQFGFTMDYNKAALASQSAAAGGANAAAMANAQAAGLASATNARLADSSIKMNNYQYDAMLDRDKRWKEVGQPQEDALIAKVNEMGSEKYRDQQLGVAVGDVNQATSDARGQTMRAAARAGIDPNSGAFAKMMTRGNADQALTLASAKNNTRKGLTQMDLANKFQLNGSLKGMAGMGDMSAGLAINAIGAGKQSAGGGGGGGGGFGAMGFGGSSGGGSSGPSVGTGLGLVNAGVNSIYGGYNTGANMAQGMGSTSTGLWNAQANYKNQQDQLAASQNPWSSVLGAATGVGLKAAIGSDRRLKTDIVAVGRMDNGLTVYRYRYIAGGPVMLGVMADEVAVIVPDAYVAGGAGNGFDAVDYSKL